MAIERNFDLERFVLAQNTNESYLNALRELAEGQKRSHWMWWIFPQLLGLGSSELSVRFALSSIAETERYLRHSVLGPRLVKSTDAILSHDGTDIIEILGTTDAQKLRSSMTLFCFTSPSSTRFTQTLKTFFEGSPCALTLQLIGACA